MTPSRALRACVLLSIIAFVVLILPTFSHAAADAQFRKSVAPVLQRRCVGCHSGKEAKGGLNLSTFLLATKGGDSGKAIIPGQPDKSLLLQYISGKEPSMPKGGKPLAPMEVAAIRHWIKSGAKWPKGLVLKDGRLDWWSFLPLKKAAVPRFEQKAQRWVCNPIDAFVLRKLRSVKLSPSPEADRRTLIRRLTFDLHGLPPTPSAVAAFVNDNRPDAYERLVERLLASPRYGERWARHWLDVAHYGDTHGFDKDKRRPHAWPYRDYVIRSFNSDKPYGDFVREQLAGDVIRKGPDGVIATGFIVAGPWDFVGHVELREGTTDKKITRNLDRDDMVTNAMTTFTSLTVHCARCHDHKFDPIKQRDYYALQAVFAGIERANRPIDASPMIAKRRGELIRQRTNLLATQKKIDAAIHKATGPRLPVLDTEIARLKKNAAGKKRPEYGYHSGISRKQSTVKWVQVDLGKPTAIKRIVLVGCHDDFNNIGAGFGFPVRYRVEVSNDPAFKQGARTVFDGTKIDRKNPGVVPQTIVIEKQTARYVRVTATKLAPRQNDYIFALAELLVRDTSGKNIATGRKVTSLDSIQAPVRWRRSNLVDGIYVGANAKATATIARLQKEREALIRKRVAKALRSRQQKIAGQLQSIESQLAKLPQRRMVYAAATSFPRQGNFTPSPNGHPRVIHRLERGSVKSPGEVVSPGTVGVIAGLPSRFELNNPQDEGRRRLALANWITDRRNPLTWRSIVNRVWQYHFGRGLVDSPNDFGRMGAQPTHPELLDWLAVRFRDNGQSLKQLHRLIVLSATYRQTSRPNPKSAIPNPQSVDAGNRYLWRMNRRRLDAESLRDAVLSISGKLRPTMYGPGYDLFGFKNDHSPHYHYAKHDVDDPRSHRRTIYRFIVRSVPDPFMETLDCADPSLNVPKRNTTITALQALALLNNKFMVRQAEHFAARIARENESPRQQLSAAYQLAFGRSPRDDESRALLLYLKKHGLANTCRLLFNTNEFLFVD